MSDDPKSSAAAEAAELWARLNGEELSESLSPALLAAYLDGALEAKARADVMRRLAVSPVEFHNARAGLDHLEGLAAERAPPDLVEAALAGLSDNVTAFRSRASLPIERFMPLAAASQTDNKAMLCRSQSGIWTLEVFVAPEDAQKGYLLLSVHSDHRDTYEGRTARVFIQIGNDERVLADRIVRDGEIYTSISLAGLDLHRRDAVNVIFGPPPP